MIQNIDNRYFISFEGIDFSGKTTQINLLESFLKKAGYEVFVLREPGGTAISEKIRTILLDKEHLEMNERAEIFLYSAARAQLVKQKIVPLLQKQSFVIADRFVDSTTAYQGYGRGIDLDVVKKINSAATYDLLPGTTLYLQINPKQAAERRKKTGQEADRLEQSGIDFFNRVFEGYQKIAEEFPERFRILEGTKPVERIHGRIVEIIKNKIPGIAK